MLTTLLSLRRQPETGSYASDTTGTAGTLRAAMSAADPTPPRDVLERARAYVRVDQHIVAALPELDKAIRSFKPVPGPAGESVADWLVERALNERALRYVGATVLVVDPFDRDTAEMWQQRFGFQDSEQPVPGSHSLRRQWLSLQS
jgi:hypothetical protein